MQKYALFHKYHDIDELYNKITFFINDSSILSMNIYSYKINSLWQAFKSFFILRPAAGGLIIKNNKLLFIKRWDKWDIPKGHVSGDESFSDCAKREVEEETGLIPGSILSVLKPTFHIYKLKEKWIMKETHWYTFSFTGKGEMRPQEEESITGVRWFGTDELIHVHNNTWPSISDVIHEAGTQLRNH